VTNAKIEKREIYETPVNFMIHADLIGRSPDTSLDSHDIIWWQVQSGDSSVIYSHNLAFCSALVSDQACERVNTGGLQFSNPPTTAHISRLVFELNKTFVRHSIVH
jgi:hypothetical protein